MNFVSSDKVIRNTLRKDEEVAIFPNPLLPTPKQTHHNVCAGGRSRPWPDFPKDSVEMSRITTGVN